MEKYQHGNEFIDETLDERYKSSHVGGAYNAKKLEKPKSLEEALSDASFGKKLNESEMLEGADFTRYVWNDRIIEGPKFTPILFPESKPASNGKGKPGLPIPNVKLPNVPKLFGPIIPYPPQAIVWNTDSDLWNITGVIGPMYWNNINNNVLSQIILKNGFWWLKSTNGNYYSINVYTDLNNISYLNINQTPSTPPYFGLPYISLYSTNSNQYQLSLSTSNIGLTSLVIGQTPSSSSIVYSSINLVDNNNDYYMVSLIYLFGNVYLNISTNN